MAGDPQDGPADPPRADDRLAPGRAAGQLWLRQSIAWLVFLSVYAIIVGHWSGWSAERPTEIAEGQDSGAG